MRIITLYSAGNRAPKIQMLLKEEDIVVSSVSVWKFIVCFERSGSLARKEGNRRPMKLTPQVMVLAEEQMNNDDETTASQLQKILNEAGIDISLWMILHCCKSLGWTFRGIAYRQLIRAANKQARLQ